MSESYSLFGAPQPPSTQRKVRRAVLNPWMSVILPTVGWGPLFIAEFIREISPELDKSYGPQRFLMGWGLTVTVLCSFLAFIVLVVNVVRLIARKGSGE